MKYMLLVHHNEQVLGALRFEIGEQRLYQEPAREKWNMTKRANDATNAQPRDVDEYLAASPEDARAALASLRKTIRAAAPMANEVISYQIPAYKHHGLLVGFAALKDHCTFHIMSTEVMRAHAVELKGYKVGKASIRFAPNKPLPVSLVRKLVKARILENESRGTGLKSYR
jgi:uncharacterized protein YdhG (YjbR/CyaY superfamily)